MIGAKFSCNICGAAAEFNPEGDWREASSCQSCGSSVRARHIAHCVTSGVLGYSIPLAATQKKSIKGIGLSDAGPLASALERAFDYTNTFYHMEPKLDICELAPHWIGAAQFVTSSDVFEHVPSPVQRAFTGAYQALQTGGLLVLTVPFDGRPTTTEHFPQVRQFKIVDFDGEYLLIGKTLTGSIEVHQNLIFHGGPGTTVEMRFFSLDDVVSNLHNSGFIDVKIHDEDVPQNGIFLAHKQGLPITARKP
jgi:hypothetical protein